MTGLVRVRPGHLSGFPRSAKVSSQLYFANSLSSTNDALADLWRADDHLPSFTVVIADHQTAGRGRLGRSWQAPAGSSLLVSVLVNLPQSAPIRGRTGWITLTAGLALRHAVADCCEIATKGDDISVSPTVDIVEDSLFSLGRGSSLGAGNSQAVEAFPGLDVAKIVVAPLPIDQRKTCTSVQVKWPNDVLISGRKVAGILCEYLDNSPRAAVIIGAGVNISQESLPTPSATSLVASGLQVTAQTRDLIAGLFLVYLRKLMQALLDPDSEIPSAQMVAELREYCLTLGARIKVNLPDSLIPTTDPSAGNNEYALSCRVVKSQIFPEVLEVCGLAGDGGLIVKDNAGELGHISAGDVAIV